MSRSLLHDWEGSIEKNKNNTEELLKIAEDIYNTAYIRGKASTERPQGEFAKLLNKRITEGVCNWCQMNKHCELCEISRVFMIIDLTDKEMNEGGAKG